MRIVLALLALVALAVALVVGATHRFQHRIDGEARAVLAGASRPGERVVEARDLEKLPTPVKRWLEASGAVGHARAATVRLRQRGEFRTAPDKPWMPVVAEQYYSVDPPGFVWSVDARMMGVLPIAGRDRYAGGHGHMLIKAASLFTVADGRGPEIDQGALLRYLGEIVWFPSAALADYVSWQAIDEHSARATMTYAGVTASMVFGFDERGRVVSEAADRYMVTGSGASLEGWFIPVTEWRKFCGVEIPTRGNTIWKLATGDFDYFRWEIVDLEVNHPALYADEPGPPRESTR
jgi:hypothetical protein